MDCRTVESRRDGRLNGQKSTGGWLIIDHREKWILRCRPDQRAKPPYLIEIIEGDGRRAAGCFLGEFGIALALIKTEQQSFRQSKEIEIKKSSQEIKIVSIEKKSLINNMTATKKALIATSSSSPVASSKPSVGLSKNFSKKGAELSKTFSKKGAELSKTFSKKGAELSKTFSKKGAELSKNLSKRGAELSKTFSKK